MRILIYSTIFFLVILLSITIADSFNLRLLDVFTFIILAWTAIETARARRSSNEANEISLLPLLTIFFEGDIFSSSVKFYLKNLGEGVAYDIKIKPWRVYFGSDKGEDWSESEMKLIVKGTNALAKNMRAELHILTFRDGKRENRTEFLTLMMTPSISEPMIGGYVTIIIEFMNAYSRRYFTVLSTGSSGVSILKPATRSTPLNRFYWHTYIKCLQFYSCLKYYHRSIKGKKISLMEYVAHILRSWKYWYKSDYSSPPVR